MINNDNYIVIQGWMINELHLKGNELLVYAIIYGFSQDENSCFKGSLQYLADFTNSTKQGVIKNLKSLLDKNLVGKRTNKINGQNQCEYYATKFNTIQHSLTDTYTTEFNGIQLSLPNNIEYMSNITNNNKEIKNNKLFFTKKVEKKSVFIKPTLEEVQEYCKRRNNKVDAKKFYDYYEVNDWKDKNGNDVKNWKQKMIANWENQKNNNKVIVQKKTSQERIDEVFKEVEEELRAEGKL